MLKLHVSDFDQDKLRDTLTSLIETLTLKSNNEIRFIKPADGLEYITVTNIYTNEDMFRILKLYLEVLIENKHDSKPFCQVFRELDMFPQIMFNKSGTVSISYTYFNTINKKGWYYVITNFISEIETVDITEDWEIIRNGCQLDYTKYIELYKEELEYTNKYFDDIEKSEKLGDKFDISHYNHTKSDYNQTVLMKKNTTRRYQGIYIRSY
jgi:hypothetical protein